MSAQNVEIVRRSFEAFARGDFDTAFAAHDPGTVWCTAADEPDQGTYRGIASVRSFAESLDELWEDRFAGVMEFEDFIERGDWVVVPWTAQMRGRGSGITVDVSETYAVQLRNRRIVRVDEYRHVQDALASLEQRRRSDIHRDGP
jgi:ketosteroid isomerase-like protein